MGHVLFRKRRARYKILNAISRYLEATLLRTFWILARLMGPAQASKTGGILMRWLGPKTHRHAKVVRNLNLAFPDLNYIQTNNLAREVWRNFGAVLAEYPHLHRLTVQKADAAIDVSIAAETQRLIKLKLPAIYVSAHLGNWELVALTLKAFGIPLSVLYGPQYNPVLNKMLLKQRRSLGCKLIDRENGLRQLIRDLESGRSVGLLPDQRVDSGINIPFLGLNAPTTTSPAWLAVRLNRPLVPVQILRVGHARFKAVIHGPIQTVTHLDNDVKIKNMTGALNTMFENWIRDCPGQWLCMKSRWPKETRRGQHTTTTSARKTQ